MPDLAWNNTFWNGHYDWNTGGEEWSECWGGSEAQWFGCIYPRLHQFLPAESVLEIAPGFGRWTKFLISASSNYIGVDISQECVDACSRIFMGNSISKSVSFMKNNGLSLANVQEGSCDLIFSFDSLVHCDMEIIQSYIPEILRVLKPGGVAFIHHSNLLAFGNSIGQPHARSLTVSANAVARSIEDMGGSPLIQEIINWGGEHMHDCLTLFGRHRAGAKLVRIENPKFMVEALSIRDFQAPWSRQVNNL